MLLVWNSASVRHAKGVASWQGAIKNKANITGLRVELNHAHVQWKGYKKLRCFFFTENKIVQIEESKRKKYGNKNWEKISLHCEERIKNEIMTAWISPKNSMSKKLEMLSLVNKNQYHQKRMN